MERRRSATVDVVVYFVLACLITWALDLRLVWSWAQRQPAPDWAMALVGLGAFGPLLAAVIVAWRRREVRSVFRPGPWRTSPIWVLVALLMPLALHQIANVIEVVLGGSPAQWFYPPSQPEYVIALVFFSLGEEFGWRGFAYPRLADRLGPVPAALIVGVVWSIWHLGMMFTQEHGAPRLTTFAYATAEFALWSIVIAWLFERCDRSMLIALAFHAGGHLDGTGRAPESEVRLRILRLLVVAIAAAIAARALTSRKPAPLATRSAP